MGKNNAPNTEIEILKQKSLIETLKAQNEPLLKERENCNQLLEIDKYNENVFFEQSLAIRQALHDLFFLKDGRIKFSEKMIKTAIEHAISYEDDEICDEYWRGLGSGFYKGLSKINLQINENKNAILEAKLKLAILQQEQEQEDENQEIELLKLRERVLEKEIELEKLKQGKNKNV